MLVDISKHWHNGQLDDITQWLKDNVGQYYGRGEGDVLQIGSGWELIMGGDRDADGCAELDSMTVHVDINDSKHATWFVLQWGD